ncbi:MbnP family protein [Sphingobacterium lactis]|uniref:Copper-binding protein MbnP-like domain-containing protein n=1 Tax=Sphingobacterium lactis TaxID=797291 RepID=A0A1H6CG34_9SPHI|nr:MbnP family protein [Sphingobacterium lactis]SEG71944.1 hypothetical protein SAMN05421877_11561 [Sphingobacterium lactis]
MKSLTSYITLALAVFTVTSCSKNESQTVANNLTLHFNNTFKGKTIVLGDANSITATKNTSAAGQVHHFAELKYVISNIRLVKADGGEIPYNINDLDKGAAVIDHAKPQTLDVILSNLPAGEYAKIKFGLGVKNELNTLDQTRFPNFYAQAGANDTKMMWEWGSGYRFTKIEGFYGTDNKPLSIHTGSTVQGSKEPFVQGVDAYREITLDLPTHAIVGAKASKIMINADFNGLLSGKTNTITLSTGTTDTDNATPNIHTAKEMVKFVDNLGGDGKSDVAGIFSVGQVNN